MSPERIATLERWARMEIRSRKSRGLLPWPPTPTERAEAAECALEAAETVRRLRERVEALAAVLAKAGDLTGTARPG